MALILTFLKANWLPLLIGIVAIGLFTRYEAVRIERDHYKTEVTTLKQDVVNRDNTIKTNNKQAAEDKAQAKADAAAITAKYAEALDNENKLTFANAKLAGDNIAKDKELSGIKFSLHAVELLNSSIESESSGVPQPSAATTDSKPTDGTSTTAGNPDSSASVSGAVVGQTIVTNNANHQACIDQVKGWQGLWADFVTKYNGFTSATSP